MNPPASADRRTPQVGESWAYRARGVDPLVEVRVVRIGVRKPARVRVRFVDDTFEGLQDWVPPARLKVPWDRASEYLAREQRWQAVIDASPIAGTAGDYASSYVFGELIEPALATTDVNGAEGLALIHDVAGLARLLELDPDLLNADPVAFIDDGALVVPWSITELIARTAARRNPEPIQRHVRTVEAEYRHRTMHGEWHCPTGQTRGIHIEADWFVNERNAPHNAPYWELLRTWSGAPTAETFDELTELRQALARTAAIAREAITMLRQEGHARKANRLERELCSNPAHA